MSVPLEQQDKPLSPHQAQISSVWHVLKNRNFVLLWMAQVLSLTILNAANFGLVALVSARSDGPILANLAIIVFILPAVPFSALAGVIVDRLNKRKVLWISNLLRLLTMLAMFFSLLHDHDKVWPLFILLFITSLIGQFFLPAEGASIPLLVGERDLMAALSLFNISITIAQAIGFLLLGRLVVGLFPPFVVTLGPMVVHVLPTDMLFVVIAFCYAICMVLILVIPKHLFNEIHLHKPADRGNTYIAVGAALHSLWRDLISGWRIVRSDRLLFFSVVQLSVVGVMLQLIAGLAGIFVKVILNRPTTDMSLILAPAGIGLVGMSIFMPRITEHIPKVRLIFVGLVALAIGLLLLPALHWVALQFDSLHGEDSPFLFWTILLAVLELGTAIAIVNIPANTMMQERSPEESRARVLSLQYMIYSAGTIPILLGAGTIAQIFGFTQVVITVSTCIIGFWLWGIWYLKRGEVKKAT
jgi:Na+/melibiose symporter-like transporter